MPTLQPEPAPQPTPQPLTRRDGIYAALLAGLAFGLYYRTLVTIPLPGDSGEFQVLVHQLGLAHTTGYSTYLLLGHLFTRLVPWGEVAFRVNLFSAVMGAATVALLYLAGTVLAGRRWAAAAGALSFAVGFTFWSQAIIAEVYTTGAAFAAGVLLALFWWQRTGSRAAILLAGALGGAGLGAHGSLGPLGLAAAIFLLLHAPRWRSWLLPATVGVAIGAALYIGGMFLVDATQAPANIYNAAYTPARDKWGLRAADVADPAQRVWFLVSAGQWRSAMFGDPGANTWPGVQAYFDLLPRDVAPLAVALALLGLLALLWRAWRVAVFLLTALLLQLVVYTNYDVGDRYVFFLLSYLLWTLLAVAGLGAILDGLAHLRMGRRAVVQAGVAMVAAAACIWPLLQPQWGAVRSGTTPFLRDAEYLVKPDTATFARVAPLVTAALEANAIVFTEWNWLYPYYYAAHIVQGKTGIQFIETYPRADVPGLAASTLDFIDAHIDARPIYISRPDPAFTRGGYIMRATPVGPISLYRLERAP